MIPALLVGSRPTWRRQMDTILLAHGIEVAWWWPQVTHLSEIPASCRVVVVATDNCSHKLSKPAMERARKAGVPLVCGPHRKSAMSPLLEKQGFPALSTLAEGFPAPFDLTHVAIATLPSSIILDLPPLTESEPESSPMRVPVTVVPPAPLRLSSTENAAYERALPLLAANPWLTVAEVAKALNIHAPTLFSPVRAARTALGVKAGQGAGAPRIIDRAAYERVCGSLGIAPVAENVGPTHAPGTAFQRAGGWRSATKAIASPAEAAAVAAAIRTLPPPPPKVEPKPEALPGEPVKDTKEALRLLLEAMRSEGVEHVAISDDGNVSIRRRVVTTSTFTL